jgi:hypothetical protein
VNNKRKNSSDENNERRIAENINKKLEEEEIKNRKLNNEMRMEREYEENQRNLRDREKAKQLLNSRKEQERKRIAKEKKDKEFEIKNRETKNRETKNREKEEENRETKNREKEEEENREREEEGEETDEYLKDPLRDIPSMSVLNDVLREINFLLMSTNNTALYLNTVEKWLNLKEGELMRREYYKMFKKLDRMNKYIIIIRTLDCLKTLTNATKLSELADKIFIDIGSSSYANIKRK